MMASRLTAISEPIMNLNARHKLYGHTIAEHIRTVPDELPIDAVGLWQIVPAGREGFGLSDDELTEFVHRCVLTLLERGAKPVMGGGGTQFDWMLQSQYGEANEEIASAIVNEWLAFGAVDSDPGGLWFALPSPYVGEN